jgi:hypothetical protein
VMRIRPITTPTAANATASDANKNRQSGHVIANHLKTTSMTTVEMVERTEIASPSPEIASIMPGCQ